MVETSKREPSGAKWLFGAVFLFFVFLHAWLMLSQRIYPFVDMPNHLAAATIFKFYDDPGNSFADYYEINTFPKPNVFHLYFCGSDIFHDVEFANRIFITIYVVLLPLCILLVIWKVGGNIWFSLLSFPLIYNFNVHWGHAGFFFSIPFLLLLFLIMLYWGENRRLMQKLIIAVLLLFLFFVHPLSLLFGLVLLIAACIHRNRGSTGGIITDLIPAIPALILIIIWWVTTARQYGNSTILYIGQYYLREYFQTMPKRFAGACTYDNYYLFQKPYGFIVALMFTLTIVSPLIYYAVRRGKLFLREICGGKNKPILLLLMCSIGCYLILPGQIPEQFHIYQRFCVFVLLSFIILGSVLYSKGTRFAVKIGLIMVVLLHAILSWGYFKGFDNGNLSFQRTLFPEGTGNETLAGLVYDTRYRGRPVYIHFQNYHIVWRKGIAVSSLIDYRFGAVKRKTGGDGLPEYIEWLGIHRYDGRYSVMDYILVRGDVPESDIEHLRGFVKVKTIDAWSLYVRKIN